MPLARGAARRPLRRSFWRAGRPRFADAAPATGRVASRHTTEGLDAPTDHPLVRRMLRRYARARGTAKKARPIKKKDALLIDRFPAILPAVPAELAPARNRALRLPGYAACMCPGCRRPGRRRSSVPSRALKRNDRFDLRGS
jgi:hypothetical protein